MASSRTQFDLAAAHQAVRDGRLEDWIQAYLRTGPWVNLGLADGLLLQRRYWCGPIELPLNDLVRVCGPEPGMRYPVPAKDWDGKTNAMARSLNDSAELPPLIAECRQGVLFVSDGNHRHEALRRAGFERGWTLVWYNSEAERRADRWRNSGSV